MATKTKNKIVQIGSVGVDSGQLVIVDPCYIGTQFTTPDSGSYCDHGHAVYRHATDKSLWQYTYNHTPQGGVNKFAGSYEDVIPAYGKTPNQLIAEKAWVETDIDPTPHIPDGEFSYRGICKATAASIGGVLDFSSGHPGVAVAFRTGFSDGVYPVYAEIEDTGTTGKRVKKVWVDFF